MMKRITAILLSALFLFLSGCAFAAESNPLLLDEPEFEYDPPNTRLQKDIVMTFTGDVSFADNWHIMQYCKKNNCTPPDLISDDLREEILNADIAHMNNEFCLSKGGSAIAKTYNFRGDPSYVEYYTQLGVDFVTLANNHVYDYGLDALLDTLVALSGYDVKYVGAGKDYEEASAPLYFTVEAKKIAFVAASRAENNVVTPEATETEPGVFWCYEPEKLIESVKTAEKNADFVVVIPHWGTEDSSELEDAQIELAKQCVDAGADLIVGGHAHCLQGIDYYKGVPIIYNLGNFLFSKTTLDTALLKVVLTPENNITVQIIPALQRNCKVFSLSGTAEGDRVLEELREYSPHVSIDEDGFVTEKDS